MLDRHLGPGWLWYSVVAVGLSGNEDCVRRILGSILHSAFCNSADAVCLRRSGVMERNRGGAGFSGGLGG